MNLETLNKSISDKLQINLYKNSDPALNGVQVGDMKQEIKKIGLMVDASMEGFKVAAKEGVDMILCHHGFFWGKPLAITNTHYKRVKFLIENNISLFAAHLPLDANLEVGNNIGIAKKLDLENIEPFGMYKGNFIGVQGQLKSPTPLDEIKKILVGNNEPVYIIPGGKDLVTNVAIVSGGAPEEVYEAIEKNMDLYITGDKSHEVYHTCLENGINMISAGHYATEVYGVKQLGEWISKKFNIETVFIDIPTGA
ncbi:MAG: Nif3-like dinuclear metal center hexameric protein [Spirochaetales bacterium]|nr:Nif3-like dinuclear metal center hexameric protein [Spirochaetales bacterium]